MHLLWPENSELAIALVLLVLALGVWAAYRALQHAALLRQEWTDVGRVEFKLDQWEKDSADLHERDNQDGAQNEEILTSNTDFRLRPSELDARLRELESLAQTKGHIRQRITAIRRLRARQVKINLDTLQHLAWSEERTRHGIDTPRQIAGWVMILGVVGTFIGLADMVQQLHVKIPGEHVNINQITGKLKEFKGILQGMRTAFSTSVVGMLVALFAAWMAHYVQGLQNRVFSALEALTVGKLIPASVSNLGDDSVLERISIQMEQAFSHLESVTAQNLKAMREFSVSHQVLRAIVDDVHKILETESRQDVHAVIDCLVETNATVAQLVLAMPGIASALSATNDELSHGLVRLDQTIGRHPVINTEPKSGFMVVTSRGVVMLLVMAMVWAVAAMFYLR